MEEKRREVYCQYIMGVYKTGQDRTRVDFARVDFAVH